MRYKQIVLILTLFFVLIPLPLFAENATKAALDLMSSLIPMGIAICLAVLFIINQINAAKKENIAYTNEKILEIKELLKEIEIELDRQINRYKERGVRNNKNFTMLNEKANKSIKVLKEIDIRLIDAETNIDDLYGATKTARRRQPKRLNPELFGTNIQQGEFDPFASLNTEVDIELSVEKDQRG